MGILSGRSPGCGAGGCNRIRFTLLCRPLPRARQRPSIRDRHSFQEDHMDVFFILPIIILLVLLAWCLVQLKDGL
ncbi:hypothetical protein [Marivita geojedonensis]|uniref:hypothetical protein n=1 Tax=Marivita geojedonensis TaxID=1123756 RepID=UPI000D40F2ED|nr:hypothetical protein [Marivita geojedonensis]PRY78547.1 hypothetical protein CLV76_106107 [Marivita geojedonensis]